MPFLLGIAHHKMLNVNTLSSNSTSPDEDKMRIVHVVHQLPSNANVITLSNKIAEHASLYKSFSQVHKEFKIREKDATASINAGIPISSLDETELQTLRDSLGFHQKSLLMLKSQIDKLQDSTTGAFGNAFTTPTL